VHYIPEFYLAEHIIYCVFTAFLISSWTSFSVCTFISKKHIRSGGMAPSVWTLFIRAVRDTPVADTPHPVSMPWVVLHIALQSLFRGYFSLCRSPILNEHCGVEGSCDHTSEWIHWVHACIGIEIPGVMPRKCLLGFLFD
jgi:hypothetical protein